MCHHTQVHTLRQEAIEAANNARLQSELSREAAALNLRRELVTGIPHPEALGAALSALARLRAAMVSCQVIGAKEPLDHTAGLLREFATSVCNDGLADPFSESAWLLLKTSIVCG